jgi:hypothetical protein
VVVVVVVVVVGGVREECVGWAVCEGGGVVRCVSRYRKNRKKKTLFLYIVFGAGGHRF